MPSKRHGHDDGVAIVLTITGQCRSGQFDERVDLAAATAGYRNVGYRSISARLVPF